ncbi:MAG: O-antigen ligase family protein, partial [Sulfobacillus sp.]
LLMLITPFQNTPFLPSFSGFNITNYLTAATLGSLILAVRFKRLQIAPFPRFILWSYMIPVTLAALHGVPNLSKMTPQLVQAMSTVYESPRKYIADLLVKPMFMLLLAWMLGTAMLNSKKPSRFLVPFVVGPLLPAVAILLYLAVGGFHFSLLASTNGRGILSRLGIFSNSFGVLLSVPFAVLLFMTPQIKGWARAGVIFALIIIGMAIILTFSRGSYLAVATSIAYFLIYNRQVKTSFLILALLASLILPFSGPIWHRVTNGFSSGAATSSVSAREQITSGRIAIWRDLMPDIFDHILIGNGVGSTAWSPPAVAGEITPNNPQNLYLDMLIDLGVIGTSLILFFYWRVSRVFKSLATNTVVSPLFRSVFRGAWIGFIGFLITGVAYNGYVTTPTQTYIWLMFGMALSFLGKGASTQPDAVRQRGVAPALNA